MQRAGEEAGEPGLPIAASIWVFVSLAVVAASLTSLSLGMRSVMEIGGACAEGGPFVPVRSCPTGVPALMVGGIWVGLVAAGLYAWKVVRHGVPGFLGLLWPALFLSLGWNFLEFGLDPPGPGGLVWGWLVCAVVFFLMGAAPLVVVLPSMWRRFTGRSGRGSLREQLVPRWIRAAAPSEPSRWAGWNLPTGDGPPWGGSAGVGVPSPGGAAPTTTTSGDPRDLVGTLERLDALHRSGALDDAEYEAAKRRILGSGGS